MKPADIQIKLQERDFEVSRHVVSQLLENHGLRRRSYLKAIRMGDFERRDDQFDKISGLKNRFLAAGLPVLSIDTKQKELLGNFHRQGHYYAQTHRKVNDHDFRSAADGLLVPHGIYDVGDNAGYLTLGTGHDTSAFVCDNIAHFWESDLQWKYPNAEWALILCDGGGSNNSRHHIVKEDLWHLAQSLDLNIIVAHYPPYCSKWNPIEHRFFCHVHRAWEGTVFHNVQFVKEQAEKTATKTGLKTKVWINENAYPIKRKVSEDFKKDLNNFVTFDPDLPALNYAFLQNNREFIF